MVRASGPGQRGRGEAGATSGWRGTVLQLEQLSERQAVEGLRFLDGRTRGDGFRKAGAYAEQFRSHLSMVMTYVRLIEGRRVRRSVPRRR